MISSRQPSIDKRFHGTAGEDRSRGSRHTAERVKKKKKKKVNTREAWMQDSVQGHAACARKTPNKGKGDANPIDCRCKCKNHVSVCTNHESSRKGLTHHYTEVAEYLCSWDSDYFRSWNRSILPAECPFDMYTVIDI